MKSKVFYLPRKEWQVWVTRQNLRNKEVGTRTFGYVGPRFVAYYYFIGWENISFGLHVCLGLPNVEIHLPFGFVRIGRPQVQVKRRGAPR